MCNGHADNCYPADPESDTSILVCRCQHNTCGPQCAKCCPGFEQKKWRISQYWDRFSCERKLFCCLNNVHNVPIEPVINFTIMKALVLFLDRSNLKVNIVLILCWEHTWLSSASIHRTINLEYSRFRVFSDTQIALNYPM